MRFPYPGRRRDFEREADDLDAAIDGALARPAGLPNSEPPALRAARALAFQTEVPEVPGASLVALRAAVAARQSARSDRQRRRAWTVVPSGVAAALAGVLVWIGVAGSNTPRHAELAAQALQTATTRINQVADVIQSDDTTAAASTAASARDALLQAQSNAATLPTTDPVRDVLLNEALSKIAQLEALLAKVNLSVPPLPSVGPAPTAAGPTVTTGSVPTTTPASSSTSTSSSTSSSTTSSTSSTSTSSSSTTSTTSSTSSTTSSTTTTSTTSPRPTTTTTTSPPPPSTTTTTAPPPPVGPDGS